MLKCKGPLPPTCFLNLAAYIAWKSNPKDSFFVLSPFLMHHTRLLRSGHTLDDIVKGTYQAAIDKQNRKKSNKNQQWDSFNAALETTDRRLKKL